MRLRQIGIVSALATIALSGCGSSTHPPTSHATAPNPAHQSAYPLLAPFQPLPNDTGLPASEQARAAHQQRELLAEAKAAARAPATPQAGCITGRTPGTSVVVLGPPAPQVAARIIGGHVDATFDYERWPSSPGCRPAYMSAVVFSRHHSSESFDNRGSVELYRLSGRRGRVAIPFPNSGRPPYHLLVTSLTPNDRQGPGALIALR